MARSKGPVREALKRESLDALEEELCSLRVAYERYFLGIDKTPPGKQHDKLDRKLRVMTSARMGSTALRFRLESLRGRYVTYRQHWTRTCRRIEDGTFVRVIAEADRRRRLSAFEAKAKREGGAQSIPADADNKVGSGEKAQAKSAPAAPPGVDPKETRELFRQYISAKRAAGESTQGISYAAMSKQIARDLPKLRARHGDGVRLEVAKVGDRVTLRARLSKK